MKKIMIMLLLCVITSASCNSKQRQTLTGSTGVVADDPTTVKAKEDIAGRIKNLYAKIAHKEDGIESLEEIGFFNDELWTQMQD